MRDFAEAVGRLGNALASGQSDDAFLAKTEAAAEEAFARLLAEQPGDQ